MTTHLHAHIEQLYHCNDTQARQAITEEADRLIRKLSEHLNWASSQAAAVGQQLMVINGSVLNGEPFCSPLNKGYLRPRLTVCEILVRTAAKNPTTFPLKERAPLQEVSVAELQKAAPCQPLLACPASLPSCPAGIHPREKPGET